MTVTINGSSGLTANDGSVFTNASGNVGIGTSSPSNAFELRGDAKRLVAQNSTNSGEVEIEAQVYNYWGGTGGPTYTGAALIQNGAGTAGTTAGVSNANLGMLRFQNSSGGLIYTNGGAPIVFATNSTERARIDSSGNAMWNGTNTTTQNGNVGYIYKFFGGANNAIIPLESSGSNRFGIFEYRRTGRSSARTAQISLGENASSQGEVQVYGSAANADISGGVVLANGATSWSAISDMRLKTVTGTYTNALQDIAQIQAIKFTWKHDQSGTPQVGVSAQSVELVVPEAIATSRNIATPDDETDYLSVRYTELIPLMIASIQELKAELDTAKARIAALEAA